MTEDARKVQTSLWTAEAAGTKVASPKVSMSQSEIQAYARQVVGTVAETLEKRSQLTRVFQVKTCDMKVADSLKL